MSLIVSSRAWEAAGWTMLHFLWVGGLIGLLAAAGRRALRGASANARYVFMLGCLAALVAAPPVIGWKVLSGGAAGGHRGQRPASSVSAPAAESLPSPGARSPAIPKTPVRTGPAVPAGGVLSALAFRLPWLWILGAPLTLSWLLLGLSGARRLQRQSRVPEDRPLHELLGRLRGSVGVARRVGLALCDRLASPVVIGIFRPIILLPPAFLAGLSLEQVELILLHELAHVRRWDNLVNLLQRLTESLLFFHPAVWIISGWARSERERACDDVVVAQTGKPRLYAETLATFALRGESVAAAAALAGSGSGRDTVNRIRRLLRPDAQKLNISRFWSGAAAGIVFLPALGVCLLAAPLGPSGPSKPLAFARFVDDGGGNGRLEAAMAAYEGPGEAEVLLVPEIVFAEADYYKRLRALFAARETVIYDGRTEIPDELADRVTGLTRTAEDFVFLTVFGLEKETAALDRSPPKFVPVLGQESPPPDDPAPPPGDSAPPAGEANGLLGSLTRLASYAANDLRAFWSYASARWSGALQTTGEKASEPGVPTGVGGIEFLAAREILILWEAYWPTAEPIAGDAAKAKSYGTAHNLAILAKLDERLAAGEKRVALYFPSPWLSELEALLTEREGFRKLRKEWITAWDTRR